MAATTTTVRDAAAVTRSMGMRRASWDANAIPVRRRAPRLSDGKRHPVIVIRPAR